MPETGGMMGYAGRALMVARCPSVPMTQAEFINARRACKRQISWLAMVWFLVWLVPFFALGTGLRSWFHEHEVASVLTLVAGIIIFLAPVLIVSRRLHERHGLLCRTCGPTGFVSDSGRCPRCKSLIYRDA